MILIISLIFFTRNVFYREYVKEYNVLKQKLVPGKTIDTIEGSSISL